MVAGKRACGCLKPSQECSSGQLLSFLKVSRCHPRSQILTNKRKG
jgi:hypothetical protein